MSKTLETAKISNAKMTCTTAQAEGPVMSPGSGALSSTSHLPYTLSSSLNLLSFLFFFLCFFLLSLSFLRDTTFFIFSVSTSTGLRPVYCPSRCPILPPASYSLSFVVFDTNKHLSQLANTIVSSILHR